MNLGATKVDNLLCGTSQIDKVIIGSESIFQRRLELILTQSQLTISLQNYIAANNPNGMKDILITNNLDQPSIISGNLIGMNVVFINNGTIKGTNAGDDGLKLTSELLLQNNGTIYGAGGNGGNGGIGGTGGRGGTGGMATSSALVYHAYVRSVTYIWLDINGNSTNFNFQGSNFQQQPNGGNNPIFMVGTSEFRKWNEDGTSGNWSVVENKITQVSGGSGGAGGAGGSGNNNGGDGESFTTFKGYGKSGANGLQGAAGRIPSSGVSYQGGQGGQGGSKGYGGDGGSFGENGLQGMKGNSGSAGRQGSGGGMPGSAGLQGQNGVEGMKAGSSIFGIEFLKIGSDKGILVGDNIIT